MTLATFLSRFPGIRPAGPMQWAAPCPAHADTTPSLAVGVGAEGRRLLHCHAGCSLPAVLAAAGLTHDDLFPRGRLRAVPAPGATASPEEGERPRPDLSVRLVSRYGPWRAIWEAAWLIGQERRVADAARAAADGMPDPESESAWALRALAAELDRAAEQAEAEQDAELRRMHDRKKKGLLP